MWQQVNYLKDSKNLKFIYNVALHQLLTDLKNLSFIYNVAVNQLLADFKKACDAVGIFLQYFQLICCSQGISYVKNCLKK